MRCDLNADIPHSQQNICSQINQTAVIYNDSHVLLFTHIANFSCFLVADMLAVSLLPVYWLVSYIYELLGIVVSISAL